jgi:hypothetical protein
MHASSTLLCALLLVACSRPARTLDELDDVVELPVVADTLPGATPLDWRAVGPLDGTPPKPFVWTCGTFDPDVVDWRSIGPVPIGEPERRFRPYAKLSRNEQRSLDSTAGALRERGVVICY